MRSIGRGTVVVVLAAAVSSTGLSNRAPSSEMISRLGKRVGNGIFLVGTGFLRPDPGRHRGVPPRVRRFRLTRLFPWGKGNVRNNHRSGLGNEDAAQPVSDPPLEERPLSC